MKEGRKEKKVRSERSVQSDVFTNFVLPAITYGGKCVAFREIIPQSDELCKEGSCLSVEKW